MCSVLVPCFDVIVIYSCLKLYLGCAIPFGERKPYVDLSDPSHVHMSDASIHVDGPYFAS